MALYCRTPKAKKILQELVILFEPVHGKTYKKASKTRHVLTQVIVHCFKANKGISIFSKYCLKILAAALR